MVVGGVVLLLVIRLVVCIAIVGGTMPPFVVWCCGWCGVVML